MPRVVVPKEITDFKEKFLWGLTKVQIVSLIFFGIFGIPLVFVSYLSFGQDIAGWVFFLVVGIVLSFTLMTRNDMPLYRFIPYGFKYFKSHKLRLNVRLNEWEKLAMYDDCNEEMKDEK